MRTQPGESLCSHNVAEMSEGSAYSEVLHAGSPKACDHVEASSGGTGNCEGASPSHCRQLAPVTPEEADIRRRTSPHSLMSLSGVGGRGVSKDHPLITQINTEVTNSEEQDRIAKRIPFLRRGIGAECAVVGETSPDRPTPDELHPPGAPVKPRREPAARRGLHGTGPRRRLNF